MIPDHWTLRRWGMKFAGAAAGFILTAAVLERARESAKSEVKVALHNHRALHHSEEIDDE